MSLTESNATLTLLPGGETRSIPVGTPIGACLPREVEGLPTLGALLNNDLLPLYHPLLTTAAARPLTLADHNGWRIYRWTLAFILAKALHETFPDTPYRIRNSFGTALYWSIDLADPSPHNLLHYVGTLKLAMQRLIEADLPITVDLLSYDEAIQRFTDNNQPDKVNLLAHRNPPAIGLIRCGAFYDLPQGPLAPRTGVLTHFDLIPHAEGFILTFPTWQNPRQIDPLPPFDHLFRIYEEHKHWGEILNLTNAGQLNAAITGQRVRDLIFTIEALHEKKLAYIADRILSRQPQPRLILIAGPSSAGKTTTSMRLMTQLRVNGLKPLMISTDSYFVGDELNPRDPETGKPDYEHIQAMDLPRLNADLLALLAGKTIHPRGFDFINKRPYDRPDPLTLPPDGVLIVEGIHSLNPTLTAEIPPEQKFHIFVSALTQLALDRNNRISTADLRLLRRIVRDHQFRGRDPIATLSHWDSVVRGEEKWIFPYQHLADAVFNSSLDYEIPVLKTLATPLLNTVKPHHAEYAEARRLTGFLQNFVEMPPERVPGNSILREYLGHSSLHYE